MHCFVESAVAVSVVRGGARGDGDVVYASPGGCAWTGAHRQRVRGGRGGRCGLRRVGGVGVHRQLRRLTLRAANGDSGGVTEGASSGSRHFATCVASFIWSDRDLTSTRARVEQVTRASASGRYTSIALRLVQPNDFDLHQLPGQFVQLQVPGEEAHRVLLTLASSPGNLAGLFEVLIGNTAGNDSYLATVGQLRAGDEVRISPVMGHGVRTAPFVVQDRLLAFADYDQGIAAVKSFIEWHRWRALSGQGAVRRCRTKFFLIADKFEDVPFADRFREWALYGVEVHPCYASDAMALHEAILALSDEEVRESAALLCTCSTETERDLRRLLLQRGMGETNIQAQTQHTVLMDTSAFVRHMTAAATDHGAASDTHATAATGTAAAVGETADPHANGSFAGGTSPGWRQQHRAAASNGTAASDDVSYAWRKKREIEDEIWRSWKAYQDQMREEFEAKHAAGRAGIDDDDDDDDDDDEWEAWFERNAEAWSVRFDEDIWGTYWEGWRAEQERWNANGGDWTQYASGYSQWEGGPRYSTNTGRREGWGDGRYSSGAGGNDEHGRSSDGGFSSTFGAVDLYHVLGVSPSASAGEIKRAYRQLARQWHPDVNRDDPDGEATRNMQRIVLAYSVLRDEAQRRVYDSRRPGF